VRVDQRLVWVDATPATQFPIEIEPGQGVVCHAWRDMDALYQVRARIAMTRSGTQPLVGLEVEQSQRIQQREYVRVPLSTQAWGFYEGLAVPGTAPAPFELQVCDLSASGLRGCTEHDLAPGDEIAIDLPLPTREGATTAAPAPLHQRGRIVALPDLPEMLNLRARVVRRIEIPRPGDIGSEIGLTFVDVPVQARERIIRYALDVQRDRRRRGTLS
jgi:c-di-GMP-binding flagellar brake protein YcgR